MATADTDCSRWRAGNHKPVVDVLRQLEVVGLGLPRGRRALLPGLGRWGLRLRAPIVPLVPLDVIRRHIGGRLGRRGRSEQLYRGRSQSSGSRHYAGGGAERSDRLSHRASTGVKHDAGGRRYPVRAAARRTVRQPGPGALACPPPASPCLTRRGGSARPRPATTWPGRSPTWAVASCWWTTTRSPA